MDKLCLPPSTRHIGWVMDNMEDFYQSASGVVKRILLEDGVTPSFGFFPQPVILGVPFTEFGFMVNGGQLPQVNGVITLMCQIEGQYRGSGTQRNQHQPVFLVLPNIIQNCLVLSECIFGRSKYELMFNYIAK